MATDVPALRPLGVGEMLDRAIKIVLRHWKPLVVLVFAIVVPLQVVSSLFALSAEDADTRTVVAAGVVAIAAALLATLLAEGACFKAIIDGYLGHGTSARESAGFVARRVHALLWLSLVSFVGVILGFIACILPGIWLFVAWSVAIPAMLAEDVRGRAALGRSFRLVRGRWWSALAVIVLATLLTSVVGAAVGFVLGFLTVFAESEAAEFVANAVASILSNVITTPFMAAVITVLYVDLRVRKEGFDLALLAERIGRGATAPPEPPYTAA